MRIVFVGHEVIRKEKSYMALDWYGRSQHLNFSLSQSNVASAWTSCGGVARRKAARVAGRYDGRARGTEEGLDTSASGRRSQEPAGVVGVGERLRQPGQ